MKRLSQSSLVLLLLCALASAPARAGRSCEERLLKQESAVQAMELAAKTMKTLESSGARFAYIARVGQDLSKYGLRYSHMGLLWREHPKGRWLVVHELNGCGTAQSELFDEGLANFFMDDMFAFETRLLFPSEAEQDKLQQLFSQRRTTLMHWPNYNMVAYPFSTKYQNSNQWVLETYAAAHLDSTVGSDPRAAAQAWLKQHGYRPTTLQIGALTRLGGRMFRANVAFDDHPFDRRMAGQIDSVTVDSVYQFLQQQDPGARMVDIK